MITRIRLTPRKGAILSAVAVVLLAACGGTPTAISTPPPIPTPTETPIPSPTPTPTSTPHPPAPVIDLDAVPDVDASITSIDLSKVWFDRFDKWALRMTNTSPEVRRELRDLIQPLYDPVYGDPDALPWLRDNALVIGFESESGAYAYPVSILNFREIVNDVIDGVPIVVTFCPLCGSGVIYSRDLNGQTLLFGNTSAIYQSDLVMFDHQTGSYWFQVSGEAVVGNLTGQRLKALPAVTIEWNRWRESHPNTKVLIKGSREDAVFSAAYGRNPQSGIEGPLNVDIFVFPVDRDRLDKRLLSGEVVITAEVNSAIKAYPLALIGDGAIMDNLGGQPVVIFSQDQGQSGAAFLATVGNRTLTFDFVGNGFVDSETGSFWSFGGLALEGPLQGAQLQALPTRRAFWFSVGISFPGIDLYLPDEE